MIDPITFRNTCGKFATGVSIILTHNQEDIHGMTANGFMSVSLDPALIVVSIGKNQKMHDLILKSKKYSVNILDEHSEKLSNHFAGKVDESLQIDFLHKENIPYLAHAMAYLTTNVVNVVDAGDHTLFIGEVVDLDIHNENKPLVFHQGKYKNLSH